MTKRKRYKRYSAEFKREALKRAREEGTTDVIFCEMRYICIDRRRTQYPVRMMCRLLKVSRSGYYAWRVRPESFRAKTDRELTRVIRKLHGESDGVYGSPKIRAELKDEGFRYGRHKVARLMRIAGLRGCPKRRFRVTTKQDPSHPVAANLIEQDFTAEAPN